MFLKIIEKIFILLRDLVCKCAVYCTCGSNCVKEASQTEE